jgi:hypothetical protein
MAVWQGSRLRPVKLSGVEEWLLEAARRYHRARVRLDPWQAVHLAQRLRREGLVVDEFTFSASSVGKLAMSLLQLVRERSLALPDDAALVDELRNVRVRESSPGVYRLDHDRHRHDDRAIALALAASYLLDRGTVPATARTWSAFTMAPNPPQTARRRRTPFYTTFAARMAKEYGDAYAPGQTREPRS